MESPQLKRFSEILEQIGSETKSTCAAGRIGGSLLLDDPLQHNDIIHAAASVDMMRNLVELQSYQLIMSSHHRAEGEFLACKFEAAGLPSPFSRSPSPRRKASGIIRRA
jgi:uncharacterized protein YhdP